MSASLRLRIGVVAAGLSCLALGYAAAQQDQPSGQPRESASSASGQTDRSSTQQYDRSTAERRTANYRGPNATAGGQNQAVDRYLASCLLAKNQAEVQLSEIAQQKSENAEVKQFAQKMIQDHRKLIEQLQPLAGMQASTERGVSGSFGTRSETQRGTTSDTPAATRSRDITATPGSPGAGATIPPSGTTAAAPAIGTTTDTTGTASATERTSASGGALHQLAQIEKQINDRCLQAAKEELQQKSGAEFDKCFVGNAIGEHVHTLATLEVISQQTQGQLAQVAQQAQPTVQQHLEHAKQLMKQLEVQAGASGIQAERKSTRSE
jgi:predicted outer membrane protein